MNKEEMLTVREWAKKAGLKLYNYDGFTKIYSRLSGEAYDNFFTSVTTRFRDAGDLLCTRSGFESRLSECTMQFPEKSEYEKMAEVIPDFVESQINRDIITYVWVFSGKMPMPEGVDTRTHLENLLDILKCKANVREKSIEINDARDKENEISSVDTTHYSPAEKKIIEEHNGTVESLEVKLLDEVSKSIEGILQGKVIHLSDIPIDKLRVLAFISDKTARKREYSKTDEELIEEFMYINVPGQKKEDLVKPYNIIGSDGIASGVVIDYENESGKVQAVLPTTPEINEKIQNNIDRKDTGVELSDDETSQALQVIDEKVTPEERKSLITRIKEFAKKFLDKLRGNDEGR